jgi:uncharacterized protein (TIGR03086 family)
MTLRMSDLLELFNRGLAEFGKRVRRVGADQWTASTPCSEWDVRTLVDQVVDEQVWAPPLMAGHELEPSAAMVESAKRALDDDRVAAWDTASLASSRAFGEPGALDRPVSLSRGATPATEYLGEMAFDLVIHSWDLGTAIGVTDPLPDELVQFGLSAGEQMGGDLSFSGVFEAPVPVADDAPAEARLIALTGRHPR